MQFPQGNVVAVAEAVIDGRAEETPFDGGEKPRIEKCRPRLVHIDYGVASPEVVPEELPVPAQDSVHVPDLISVFHAKTVVILAPAGIAAELLVRTALKTFATQKALPLILHICDFYFCRRQK